MFPWVGRMRHRSRPVGKGKNPAAPHYAGLRRFPEVWCTLTGPNTAAGEWNVDETNVQKLFLFDFFFTFRSWLPQRSWSRGGTHEKRWAAQTGSTRDDLATRGRSQYWWGGGTAPLGEIARNFDECHILIPTLVLVTNLNCGSFR